MNQTAIGSYIARKRREQNLTQEQLAQQLGVSNKTISKWENGKCMPDYSIIEPLCDALHVTLPELMDGEDAAEDGVRVYDDEQIPELLRCVQNFISGVLMGLSVAEILAGIWTSAPEAVKNTVFFEPIIRFKEGGAFILFIALARPPAQAATPGACASWLGTRRCGQDGMRRTELTDRVQITFSIADPLPVLQRLAVAALKDDAIILQKRFLLSQTQIHDPVFRVRDHDFPHASVARAVHHAANLLRRNMPRRKYGIIRLDQRENVEQLRQKITSAVRHADATRFSALAIFVLCVHGRQPDDLPANELSPWTARLYALHSAARETVPQ